MVAYVMLVIDIFVLVYSLTISEVAVTFPSCFTPRRNAPCRSDFLHSVFVVFKYKVFISDNIFADTDISVIILDK